MVRPADANETAVAWRPILEHTDRPAGLALTRQNLPVLDRGQRSPRASAKGGYVLADASAGLPAGHPDRAPAPRLQIAVAARERARGRRHARPGSCRCRAGVVREQDAGLPQQVLPPDVKARVSVEAGVAAGLARARRRRRRDRRHRALRRAAPTYSVLFEQFGFTADRVVAAAHAITAQRAGTTSAAATTGN